MHPDYGYFEESQLGKPYDMKLLKRLYPYTRPYRRLLFWSIGLVLLITALDLALPIVTKVAIDRYIVPQTASRPVENNAGPQDKDRLFRVSISDPVKRKLVLKYSHLFKIEDSTASIPHTALVQIDKADLAMLRRHDVYGLGIISALFLGLVVINFGLNFIQKMIMEYTGHMIMHDLRMRLFSHIQDLAIDFFTRNPVARLVTRVTNDVQNMHELFTSVISLVFKDLFLLVGIAVVMLLLSWKLALVSFIVLPVVLYASLNFSKRARDIFRQLRVKIAEINTRFSETIGGIRIVQLFRQEFHNYGRFKILNHENYLAGMRQIHVLAVFMPLIELLGVIAVALIIFYGGGRVLTGALSLGELVAFITYIRMFFRPIRDLAEKYNILQNAMASAERIFLILDTKNTLQQSPDHPKTASLHLDQIGEVKLEGVSFSYVKNEPVLKAVSFAIQAGETVAVVGLSPREERYSHQVAKYLQSQGYHIIPVNPNADEVLGERSYPDLVSIPEPIDVVDVFRRSEAVPEIVEEAIKVGAKTVWMQEGVIHEEAAARAREAGLQVVMDRCTMKEHRRHHFERGRTKGRKARKGEEDSESSHHWTD